MGLHFSASTSCADAHFQPVMDEDNCLSSWTKQEKLDHKHTSTPETSPIRAQLLVYRFFCVSVSLSCLLPLTQMVPLRARTLGLEREFSNLKHWLFCQRTWIWLQNPCDSSQLPIITVSRESDIFFQSLRALQVRKKRQRSRHTSSQQAQCFI